MVSNSWSSQKYKVVMYFSRVKTMPEVTVSELTVFLHIPNASGIINRRSRPNFRLLV